MISKQQVPRINSEQVQHIAKLARIELTDQEKRKFQKELSSILDYVEKLNKIGTSKIERIAQITGLKDVMREDTRMKMRIKSELDTNVQKKILKQVPDKKDNYIKVPKILE